MFAVFSHLISLVFIKDRPVSSFWVLRFRVLGASFSILGSSFSSFECFVFEIWVLPFRVLGASFSSFGCFVLRSSFSSASFSKLLRSSFSSASFSKLPIKDSDYEVLSS